METRCQNKRLCLYGKWKPWGSHIPGLTSFFNLPFSHIDLSSSLCERMFVAITQSWSQINVLNVKQKANCFLKRFNLVKHRLEQQEHSEASWKRSIIEWKLQPGYCFSTPGYFCPTTGYCFSCGSKNPSHGICRLQWTMKEEANIGSLQEFFECPGPEDPEDHTICCEQKCCPLRSRIC